MNYLGTCPAILLDGTTCGADLLVSGDRILPTDYVEGPCVCGAWVVYHGDQDGRVTVENGHGREVAACVVRGMG